MYCIVPELSWIVDRMIVVAVFERAGVLQGGSTVDIVRYGCFSLLSAFLFPPDEPVVTPSPFPPAKYVQFHSLDPEELSAERLRGFNAS